MSRPTSPASFFQRMRDLLAAIEQAESAMEKELARQQMAAFLVQHGQRKSKT